MLQVSRSSIRKAILDLELKGLVEPRQGVETIVREVSAESLVNPLINVLKHQRELISELLDFREMLERPLAVRWQCPITGEKSPFHSLTWVKTCNWFRQLTKTNYFSDLRVSICEE